MPKLAVPDDISKNRSMCSQESLRQRGGRGLRHNVKTMSNEIFFWLMKGYIKTIIFIK